MTAQELQIQSWQHAMPVVRAIARPRLDVLERNGLTTEDLEQEVALRLVRRDRKDPGGVRNTRALAARITVAYVTDLIRKHPPAFADIETLGNLAGPDPAREEFEAAELQREIEQLLGEDVERQVLRLCRAGLGRAEIAAALGITEGGVKVILERIRRKVRRADARAEPELRIAPPRRSSAEPQGSRAAA